MNSKEIGEISEAAVLFKLLTLGYAVSKPFGDSQEYDLIVDTRKELKRVQIKTGRYKNGVISVSLTRRKGMWGSGGGHRVLYTNVDAFVVYVHKLHKFYWIDASGLSNTELTLRVAPTKNKQSKHVVWANVYELP